MSGIDTFDIDKIVCPFRSLATYKVVTSSCTADLPQAVHQTAELLVTKKDFPSRSYVLSINPIVHDHKIDRLAPLLNTVVSDLIFMKAGVLGDIEAESWRLNLFGEDYFSLVMSSAYPDDHPRFYPASTLIIFQPEDQFSALGISSSPRRLLLSEAARSAFADAGRRFFGLHEASVPKARRFVLDAYGNGLEWWNSGRL